MAEVTDFNSANLIIAQNYAAIRAALATPGAQAALDQIVSEVVPPAKVSHFFEFCYTHKDELAPAQKSAAADVGHFAWVNGFYGLGQDQRGSLIEAILRGQQLPTGSEAPIPLP